MKVAQPNKSTLSAQFKKAWRGFQRTMAGESGNSVYMTTIAAQGSSAKTQITRVYPLQFEKSEAVLQGPAADVRHLRRLDMTIGKLIKPFNGVSRVPDSVVEQIERHVADLETSFRKVSAVTSHHDQAKLRNLEFVSIHPTNTGGTVEQRLVKIRLG